MQSLEEFNIFKAEECQERLCPCYRENHGDEDELPDDYAECPCFHNKLDKRREPFLDLVTCKLAYQATEPSYSSPDPEGCRNDIEYKYHPKNFKALPCKRCPGYYCPYFHDQEEKQKWDKLLRKASPLKFPGAANNDIQNEKVNVSAIQIEKGNIEGAHRSKSVMKTQDTSYKAEGINSDPLKNQYFDFDIPSSNQREQGSTLSLYEQIASNMKGESYLPKKATISPSDSKIEPEKMDLIKDNLGNEISVIQSISSSVGPQSKAQTVLKEKEEEKVVAIHKSSSEKILEESFDKGNLLKNIEQNEVDGSWKIVGNVPIGHKVDPEKAYNVQEIENYRLKKNKPVLNDIPFTYGSRIYIHKEKVQIFENPLQDYYCLGKIVSFENLVEQHVCAFLNSAGGVIYLGINENFQSFGVKMDRKMLDDLSITFDRKLKSFSPAVRADQYNIKACYVFDKQQRMYSKDHYVVEIEIVKGDPAELYFNDRGACYMRKNNNTVCLDTKAIKNEVRTRTQKSLANNLIELLDNVGFDEGLRGIKEEKRTEDLINMKKLIQEKIKLIDNMMKEDQGNYYQFLNKLQVGQESSGLNQH